MHHFPAADRGGQHPAANILSFNGFFPFRGSFNDFSPTINGQYTCWGFEHIMTAPTANANIIAFAAALESGSQATWPSPYSIPFLARMSRAVRPVDWLRQNDHATVIQYLFAARGWGNPPNGFIPFNLGSGRADGADRRLGCEADTNSDTVAALRQLVEQQNRKLDELNEKVRLLEDREKQRDMASAEKHLPAIVIDTNGVPIATVAAS